MDELRRAWEGLTAEERALASHLLDAESPVGAAKAQRFLANAHFKVSQATVSRSLRKLDQTGFTESVGRAGRQLTRSARDHLERELRHRRRNTLLDGMFEGADRAKLVDLLHLREGIEVSVVDLVVDRAEPGDFDAIDASVLAYDQHVQEGGDFSADALEFHLRICRASHSDAYGMIADVLFPEMGRLEPLLVLAARAADESSRSSDEHARIAAALRAGDRQDARRLLHEHFESMIAWIEQIDDAGFEALART
jgi:DNA-binding FadR family transcriptional regulator